MAKISRQAYAEMFGPTTGDRLRLADTELWLEVESDFTVYGNEKGPMLQRIYGTAWESKSALAEHLPRLQPRHRHRQSRQATVSSPPIPRPRKG